MSTGYSFSQTVIVLIALTSIISKIFRRKEDLKIQHSRYFGRKRSFATFLGTEKLFPDYFETSQFSATVKLASFWVKTYLTPALRIKPKKTK